MKKLKITILATLLSFSAMSQIIIKTEGTEIILPKSAKKELKSKLISNNDGTVTIIKGGDYECEGLFMSFNYTKLNGVNLLPSIFSASAPNQFFRTVA